MGNGIKTFFKVFYIALGLIVAVFVAIIAYNNYAIAHIQSLAKSAVTTKNYSEIERIFGTFFSTEAIVNESTDQYDLVVYPSVAFSQYTYYNASDESITYENEDNAYYIYLIKPSLDIINDVKTPELSNEAGIRLNFSDDTSYLYYLAVDSTYNTKLYKEKPTTQEEAILYSKRNTFTAYEYLEYFDITITSSIIDAAKTYSNTDSSATVSSISVVNSSGRDVAKYDVNMDFSQSFYTLAEPYVTAYNKYINDYKASTTTDEKKALTADFEKFFYGDNKDGFYYTFPNNANCGVGYGKDYAYPWWLILKAGGMTLLFSVVLFLLYMLLFHFAYLKKLAERLTSGARRRNQGRRGNVDVEASRIQKVAPKVEEVEVIEEPKTLEEPEVVEEVKEDTKEETVEAQPETNINNEENGSTTKSHNKP